MTAYYNENDPGAAAWLRELVARGLIAPGEVDERSIEDVTPNDLRPFQQHHFFAGIGGWSYALRLAGWPDNRPVWTGSCPCQPFSAAGKGAGFADERHLWPAWHWLIEQCRPRVVVGEQVAVAGDWLDLVCADLEGIGYAVGAVVLPACSVGAPHIRSRLWWVGHAEAARLPQREREPGALGAADGAPPRQGPEQAGDARGLGDADAGRQQVVRLEEHRDEQGEPGQLADGPGARGWWDRAQWLECADGKSRPVEPGIEPLAHGVPARVVQLRGFGNAITPQLAAEVIRAVM